MALNCDYSKICVIWLPVLGCSVPATELRLGFYFWRSSLLHNRLKLIEFYMYCMCMCAFCAWRSLQRSEEKLDPFKLEFQVVGRGHVWAQARVRGKSREGNTWLIAESFRQPLTDFCFCNDLVPSFPLPPYGGRVGGAFKYRLLKLHNWQENDLLGISFVFKSMRLALCCPLVKCTVQAIMYFPHNE